MPVSDIRNEPDSGSEWDDNEDPDEIRVARLDEDDPVDDNDEELIFPQLDLQLRQNIFGKSMSKFYFYKE